MVGKKRLENGKEVEKICPRKCKYWRLLGKSESGKGPVLAYKAVLLQWIS